MPRISLTFFATLLTNSFICSLTSALVTFLAGRGGTSALRALAGRTFAAAWAAPDFLFINSLFNYWGSIPVALGWVGVVMLTLKSGLALDITSRLSAVGRMAFSNYILQTVMCTTIFYGHGLGLFGSIDRSGQLLVVFAVWGFQLWLSPLWLSAFRFGPLEWLWRSLVYMKVQPMRNPSVP